MARQLILQNLMKLARGIGANPSKFMGTKTNITFLGKGPTKNPLFQSPIAGLEGATEAQLGSRESMIGAVEDAMGYATAQKLNSIQIRALELNLQNIFKIYNPPALPSASVTNIGAGIEGLRRFPRETHKFMGRPLKSKDFAEIDELVKRGKLPGPGKSFLEEMGARGHKVLKPGTPEYAAYTKKGLRTFPGDLDLPQKTYAARATMYRLLDMEAGQGGLTLREIMSPQDLKMLLEGGGGVKGDMIAMFGKYFGNAATRQLPNVTTPQVIEEFATQVIRKKDAMGRGINDPFFRPEDFAHGGLARILEV